MTAKALRSPTLIACTVLALQWQSCKNQSFVGSNKSGNSPRNTAQPDNSPTPADKIQNAAQDPIDSKPRPAEGPGKGIPSADMKSGKGQGLIEYYLGKNLPTTNVDIIFAMDTSESMAEEKSRLEAQMGRFLQQLSEKQYNLDFQVFMIGENFQFPQNSTASKMALVPLRVGSHDALKISQYFLSTGAASTMRLRNGSTKELVIISDQDSDQKLLKEFQAYINGFKDKIHINSIVGLPNSLQTSSCRILAAGRSYIDLSRKTEGTIQDLCSEDWGDLLDTLARSIISGSRGAIFALRFQADTRAGIKVLLNGKPLPESEFTYDPDGPSIILGTTPGDDVNIEIHYAAVSP